MDSGRLIFDGGSHGNMLPMGSSDGVFRVVGARSVLGMEETLRSRPFFSSHDELMEEEYYDEQLPEKKRRLLPEQVHMLERSFKTENKLEPERKMELAKKLGLQPRQVAVWFQNRRARWKAKQLERDFDLLKSSYDSLVSNYDLALKENERLKSEVHSLTEKLRAKENSGQLPVATPKAEPGGAPGEDLTSSGSGGSAVVDDSPQQVIDSGDSYYPEEYPDCIAPSIDGVQSEEDDGGGNDDNGYYFSDVFATATTDDNLAAEHHPQEQEQQFGWWVWS